MNIKAFAIISMVVAVIGSCMPWVTIQYAFGEISVAGTTGDGQITLILAFLAGLFCVFDKRGLIVLSTIACAIGFVVSMVDTLRVADRVSNSTGQVHATVGYGLYLCMIGFAFGFFLMIALFKKTPSSQKAHELDQEKFNAVLGRHGA